MGSNDKQSASPKKGKEKAPNKPKTPAPAADMNDDDEDGDIATPKRDHYGNDDEPL